jgi:hypothetical protein
MSYIDSIINLVTDKARPLSSRATYTIIIVLLVIVADNLIGFSYYYTNDKKLDQLKSISILLKDTTLPADTRVQLLNMETEIISRQNVKDYFFSFLKNISWTSSKNKQSANANNPNPIRDNFWQTITSGGFFILTVLIFVPIIFITDKRTPLLQKIFTIFLIAILMVAAAWFYTWLFSLIPMIGKTWTWNYILNVVLQILLILMFIYVDKYSKKQTIKNYS